MVKPTSVKDVDQHEIVRQIAGFLKKSGKVKVPEWSDLVKLGITKELAPVDSDWYYVRTASVARRLYIRSPTGVGALRRVYGSNKRRGVTPNHFAKASGSVIRKALQTLEAIKWVEKHPDGNGRILTKQGRKDLDRIASQMRQNTKITLEP
uniref:Ribosomal protein S19S n=2 Tax=Parascaris univalens TaxID=6257 RepID=A0A915BG35_PARUN